MKRWTLSATEERVLRFAVDEYLEARAARDAARRALLEAEAQTDSTRRSMSRMVASERLFAARESIRVTSEVIRLVRWMPR